MSKNRKTVKLNKSQSHVKSILRNLLVSLVLHEVIVTTSAKAKALKPYFEKFIDKVKKGDINGEKYAMTFTSDKVAIKKIFDILVPRYAGRVGGYVKIKKLGIRQGDSSLMCEVSLIDGKKVAFIKRKVEKSKKAKQATKKVEKSKKIEVAKKSTKLKKDAVVPEKKAKIAVEDTKVQEEKPEEKKESFADKLSKFLGLKRKPSNPKQDDKIK